MTLPTSTGGTGQEEKYELLTKFQVEALNIRIERGWIKNAEAIRKLIDRLDQALDEIGAFRYVAIQNYNAPAGLSDQDICSLVDAEAKRLLSEKNGEKS